MKVTDDKEKCDDEQLFISCATDQIGAENISVWSALWWKRRVEKKKNDFSLIRSMKEKRDFSFFTHYWDLPLTGTAGTAKVTDHETDHETSSETGRQDEHWQGEWDLQVKLTVRQAGLVCYHRAMLFPHSINTPQQLASYHSRLRGFITSCSSCTTDLCSNTWATQARETLRTHIKHRNAWLNKHWVFSPLFIC